MVCPRAKKRERHAVKLVRSSPGTRDAFLATDLAILSLKFVVKKWGARQVHKVEVGSEDESRTRRALISNPFSKSFLIVLTEYD